MIKYKFLIRIVLVLAAFVFVTASCIDEYWPELGVRYENALVIDGLITDNPGPYTVTLSLSSTVDDAAFIPLLGCEVTIADDLGNAETLTESVNGTYQTSANGLRGVVGRSYKLSIITRLGKVYESDFEKLNLPTEIDSIYGKIEYKAEPNGEFTNEGIQFYLDTYMAEQDTNYYLWQIESTFKYNANHYLRFYFDGDFHKFKPIDSLYTCWSTLRGREIFTYSTVNLNEPMVRSFPLNYVTTNTKMLSKRYSLHVKQLSINKEAYVFWKSLAEVNTESGSLFAKQPYQLRSNVKNPDNEDEPVLGYFIVAGMSDKRIFVDRPKELDFYYKDQCNMITEELRIILMSIQSQWPVKLAGKPTGFGVIPGLTADEACVDCTQEFIGATVIEPTFWEE